MTETTDLDALARYWTKRYADMMRAETTEYPLVSVCGYESDAIGVAEGFGKDYIEDMAWLTGYRSYPCDAIYVTAVMDVEPDVAVTWTHLLATNETRVLALHLDREARQYVPVDLTGKYSEEFWEPLRIAAHDFDQFTIYSDEGKDRKAARDEIIRHNGTGYHVKLMDPGTSLNAARSTT